MSNPNYRECDGRYSVEGYEENLVRLRHTTRMDIGPKYVHVRGLVLVYGRVPDIGEVVTVCNGGIVKNQVGDAG